MVSIPLFVGCIDSKSIRGAKVVGIITRGLKAETLEERIEKFNASQIEYKVKGFSLPNK